jgi:hypothetical protein
MKHTIKQIRIGKHDFGIVGLTEAFKTVSGASSNHSDSAIADALFNILKKQNYIPDHAVDKYKEAFLREYLKHLGKPLPSSIAEDKELTVTLVGAGCAQCDSIVNNVMQVLSELNLPARIDYVRDPDEINQMGIRGVPAVMINGEVKCVGIVPFKSQLIEWLKPYGCL